MTIERAIEILDPEHREHYESIEPVNEACRMGMNALKELSELKDKLESGKLVELPCKVGDKVYEVFKEHKPPFIKETTIEKIVITEKGFKLRLSRNSVYETAISSLGKTVFLTKAEAEARMKELQEKQK